MAEQLSAGILLYRRGGKGLEVLLAHPGGPYFARKDAGAWTIPKGEPGTEGSPSPEGLLAAARREFEEETGHRPPEGPAIHLGAVRQLGGKAVHGWAYEGDLDPQRTVSNTFELEWPPGSGRRESFPEVDRVAWFTADEARRRIRATQTPFIDRLAEALTGRGTGG